MRSLRYLDGARSDLVDILAYLTRQSGSVSVGQAFTARIRARCRELATLPGHMGRPRDELRAGIRSLPFQNYVLFFRYVDDTLEIISILEGHRDIDAYFAS